MFLHSLADKSDIIAENSKFGYSEHIKLAKKIIGFGSIQSQLYVMNNANKSSSVLPSIVTIYHKDDILIKTKNHRRKRSNESDSSPNNKSNVDSNIGTRSSSNCSNRNSSTEKKENENKEFSLNNNINIIEGNDVNKLFKFRNSSRFDFVNLNKDNLNKNKNESNIILDLVDELTSRLSFFIQFDKNIPLSEIEYDYCRKLYNKSKNDILRKIIENQFK